MPRSTIEMRYHVEVFDDSGANVPIRNLTREELDEFRESHMTDDLNYSYHVGPMDMG